MTKPTTIYGLIDPRDGQLRYIGKTIDPKKRLSAHMCRTHLTPKRYSSCWLSGLASLGLKPIPVVMETVPVGRDWQAAERRWIAKYRAQGARLTNLVDGGEGVAGYVFPPERREYLSIKFAGRKFDEKWRANISAAKRGRACPQTPETVVKRTAAIRAAYAARPQRTHCKEGHQLIGDNVRTNKRGHRFCVTCYRAAKLEGYHRRKPPLLSPEERSERLRAARAKPEVRARMSAAQKARSRTSEELASARKRLKALNAREGFREAAAAAYTFAARSKTSRSLWAERHDEIVAKRNATCKARAAKARCGKLLGAL